MARRSVGTPNTIFNYFNKSPASASAKRKSPESIQNFVTEPAKKVAKKTPVKSKEPAPKIAKESTVKSDSENEEEILVTPQRKRIRLISEDSDDSNAENIDKNNTKNRLESSFKYEGKTSSPSSTRTPNSKKLKKDNSSENRVNDELKSAAEESDGNWLHCQLDWLKPENIRDAERRKTDHPDYDPKTLYIPADFRKDQTPAHKQWWEIKSAHYDCVLFFKVGKFYELFHMDASVGVTELGFTYMKGDYAHSGFPETAYARMASLLVQKGYKVARVEQTETPEMMQERVKKMGLLTKEKAVRREICQITCKGTEVCGLQDNGPTGANLNYMLAISESDLGAGCSKYGICFIDTSIGVFHIGQFDDDRHSSKLLTTLAHYPPSLVLLERNMITERMNKVLRMACMSARKEFLTPVKQFWSAAQTLKSMAENYYHKESGVNWPEGFKPMLSEADSLGLTPANNCDLAIKALGACIWYLKDSLLDIQIMEMSQFDIYQPPESKTLPKINNTKSDLPSNMVLDASTIMNLNIVGEDLSLLSKLDHCVTPMGKRLLHQWVCSPSCNVDTIKERQVAITFLLNNQHIVQDVRSILNTLPDMERFLAKIHSLGNLNRSKNHPDSRAILYEDKAYSKRKVLDFISLLNGFQAARNAVSQFDECDSALINRITGVAPNGLYPDYTETLQFFKGAFDHKLAEKEGIILPEKGVDSEYDHALKEIAEINEELQDYLKTQEKHFNCRVTYFGSDKKRFQLEVPESKAGRAGHGYSLEGTRKGYKRFSTSETKELLARMIAAEDQKRDVLKDLSRRIFEKFSQSYNQWQRAVNSIAMLDVLISLSEYSRLLSGDVCIPVFDVISDTRKPFISIKDGKHPCVPCSVDFIPNDTNLNETGDSSLILLTGPNMGGKSTLMRQLGLLTIMAQIGCHIPASECSLTIVDRIFTRLGAHDDIMAGQSTFLVELSETAAILKHTTIHSLVLLDELGRGTSTYDGTAIAAAVVDELSGRGCRTMFSTHYHTLVEDFKKNTNVSLAHMACMVETEESEADNGDSVTQETVTFLYKLADGACPKSYGFNAARLAGISKEITMRAHKIAMQMEKEANLVALFKKLYTSASNKADNFKELILSSKI